jgi:hypothetical protein
MQFMESFEQAGSRGFFRPVAQVTFEQAVDLVERAIARARAQGLSDLLVDTTRLGGFTPPSVFARYAMATKWVGAAGASLRVAIVARAELIDPQKIGILVLQNRGGSGDVFTSETDALAWLDKRNRGTDASERTRESRDAHGHRGQE